MATSEDVPITAAPAKGPPTLSAFGMARTPPDIQTMARRCEEAGFGRLWVPEGPQPVFSMCTAAALATSSLAYGTGVAVAFPRSPMLTAQSAWMLSAMTEGRFILGLGTQVKAHIERRFSSPFAPPGPRMREYVLALRAIFAAFREVEPLNFEGDFYSFNLLPRIWSPGPMPYSDPPIYVAGVRNWMCRMVGETADGMLVHPMNGRSYLEEVVLPGVRRGEQEAGRPSGSVAIVCPAMIAVSDDDEVRDRQREAIRARVAFYGSTPGYGVIFDTLGWPGVGERLNSLQRSGNFDQMFDTIADEMLDEIAVTSTWDDLPRRLLSRFEGTADDIVCYSVFEQWDDEPDVLARWQDVNRQFRELADR